jgi:hypothetical protein
MRKITVNDPMLVKVGDKAYFKGCDFGFTVSRTDNEDRYAPFTVVTPFSEYVCWALSSRFDHATREVEEPEWPDPHDLRLRIYLGADGKRYIYNPTEKKNVFCQWLAEGSLSFRSRNAMESYYRDALPLTELKLVPVKDDDGE